MVYTEMSNNKLNKNKQQQQQQPQLPITINSEYIDDSDRELDIEQQQQQPIITSKNNNPMDEYTTLYTALESRSELASQCILVMTRIIKEMKKPINTASNQSTATATATTSKYLSALRDSIAHADATMNEIINLLDQFKSIPVIINSNSNSTRDRLQRENSRNQLLADITDLQHRYKQISKLAQQKLILAITAQPIAAAAAAANNTTAIDNNNKSKSKSTPSKSGSGSGSAAALAAAYESERLKLLQERDYQFTAQQQQQSQQQSQLVQNSSFDSNLTDNTTDIEIRNEFAHSIERDINRIHSMYIDIHELVYQQDESINLLEYNINTSNNRTELGLNEISRAEYYQRKKRSRMSCLILIALLIILILILTLWIIF